eukprot:310347-Prymnesium_polylepis.1
MPFDHREAHTSGSGTESEGTEGRDRDSQDRERRTRVVSMQLRAGGAGGWREQSGGRCAVGAGND